MIEPAWVGLSDEDHEQVWALFQAKTQFRPSTEERDFPGIKEPTPSATWDIAAAYMDPDPLMRRTHSRFNESMLEVFRALVDPSSGLIVLEWHGPGFRFFPHRHHGSCLPHGHAKGEPATWKTPVLPDGEYSMFLADDLSFGTFGHPWEGTVCVWGESFLTAMPQLPLDGAKLVRRNGTAV